MGNINLVTVSPSTAAIFKGAGPVYGVSGSVWNVNVNGEFLFYIDNTAADKNNWLGNVGMLANAAKIQTIALAGDPNEVWVFAPYREAGVGNTVKVWVFPNPDTFTNDFRLIPGDAGQLPFANIADPVGNASLLAQYLAVTGSAACFSGDGIPLYIYTSWPFQ
jgi:hypothetical protein